MNKNLIYLGPVALIIAGYLWSAHINPGASVSYNFGFGFGMFLIPAIPGLIFALIHRSFSKKKLVDANSELLDDNEIVKKKNSFMFYFSLYSTLIGAVMFAGVMSS